MREVGQEPLANYLFEILPHWEEGVERWMKVKGERHPVDNVKVKGMFQSNPQDLSVELPVHQDLGVEFVGDPGSICPPGSYQLCSHSWAAPRNLPYSSRQALGMYPPHWSLQSGC